MAKTGLINVRATIHLAKLTAGTRALVDPKDPYIQGCLAKGYLVQEKP